MNSDEAAEFTARSLPITGAGKMDRIDRGEIDKHMLRSLVHHCHNWREDLLLWRAYFAKLHVVITEPIVTRREGKSKGKGKWDDLNVIEVKRITIYKVLITTRIGQRTYIGFELRDDSPQQTEIKSGVPIASRANGEHNFVSLARVDRYLALMRGKLKQSIVVPGGVTVHEAGDSTTVAEERPALPATYTLSWRWATAAVPPDTKQEGSEDPVANTGAAAAEGTTTTTTDEGITTTEVMAEETGALSNSPERATKRARGETWNNSVTF